MYNFITYLRYLLPLAFYKCFEIQNYQKQRSVCFYSIRVEASYEADCVYVFDYFSYFCDPYYSWFSFLCEKSLFVNLPCAWGSFSVVRIDACGGAVVIIGLADFQSVYCCIGCIVGGPLCCRLVILLQFYVSLVSHSCDFNSYLPEKRPSVSFLCNRS